MNPPSTLLDIASKAGLTFDQMVPRALVHKSALEEVMLCDYKQLDANEYLVTAQLPRCHNFFNDVALPYYDFTAVGEVLRQTGLLTGHCFHSVPVGTHYIFRTMAGSTEREGVHAMRIGDTPTDLHVHYSYRNLRARRGRLTAFEGFGRVFANGVYIGSGTGHCQLMPPATYHTLRGMARQSAEVDQPSVAKPSVPELEPVSPSLVGRRDVRNVVIENFARKETTSNVYTATLVIPLDHRVFFDHPQDHVPGMLMMEAGRQLALGAATAHHHLDPNKLYTSAMRVEFTNFAELDAPCIVVANVGVLKCETPNRRVEVEVEVRQYDAVSTRSTWTLDEIQTTH